MKAPLPFTGSPRGARFTVVRWPDGEMLYFGSLGAKARDAYENVAPKTGQAIEFWDGKDMRSRKGLTLT